jgi:putative ABC transport system substrate-binding protein
MQMQSGQLKRRELITLLGSAAVALPLRARAEQVDRLRMIAILGDNASVWSPWTTTFVGRLRQLGWIEDRNVAFEYRWSGGQAEPVAEFAAEFVRQNVDAIVTYGGAVKTLKQATASIPIVFAIAVDPVGIGLVPNLSHPGGNATGLSVQSTDLAGKRLELFREVAPGFRRLAIIFDSDYPAAVLGASRFNPPLVPCISKPLSTRYGGRRILLRLLKLSRVKQTLYTSWKMLSFPPAAPRLPHSR